MISPTQMSDCLRRHRDECIDAIPDQIIHGARNAAGNGPKYKAQVNWFDHIVGDLEYTRAQGIVSDEIGRRIDVFIEYYCSMAFKVRLTTREDIDTANAIISDVITDIAEKAKEATTALA